MLFVYIFLGVISILLLNLIIKIDTAIDLIYNRLNIENEIWGSDRNV